MDKTKKAPGGAIQNSHGKDSDISRVMQRIKNYFLSGRHGTAIEINIECHTGDARKRISELRKLGWKIQDRVIDGSQKEYWLDPEQRDRFTSKRTESWGKK